MSIVKLDEDSSAIYAFVTLVVEISTRGIRLLLWIFFSLNNKPSLNALTQKDSSREIILKVIYLRLQVRVSERIKAAKTRSTGQKLGIWV